MWMWAQMFHSALSVIHMTDLSGHVLIIRTAKVPVSRQLMPNLLPNSFQESSRSKTAAYGTVQPSCSWQLNLLFLPHCISVPRSRHGGHSDIGALREQRLADQPGRISMARVFSISGPRCGQSAGRVYGSIQSHALYMSPSQSGKS